MREFLLKFVENLTGHLRYHPEEFELDHKMHWSNKIWVSNIFRAYEWLFGRGFGIRKESCVWIDKNGKVHREFYTLEAFLSHMEGTIRQLLCTYFDITNIFFNTNLFYQRGAIVLDTNTNGTATSTSPITWSHTCTGSNLILHVAGYEKATGASISTPTYNSVTMTIVQSEVGGSGGDTALFYLLNPSTGSNTVSFAFGGVSKTAQGASLSWSGVAQTGQPDASNKTSLGNSANPSVTVTVVASNCWTIGTCAATATLTANLTNRFTQLYASGQNGSLEDSNGEVSTGNNAVSWTMTSARWGVVAASFAPANSFISRLATLGAG